MTNGIKCDKCEVLPIGMSNQGRTCTLNGRALDSVIELGDLEVQVHESGESDGQYGEKGLWRTCLHWEGD